jgi:hypothetical protein
MILQKERRAPKLLAEGERAADEREKRSTARDNALGHLNRLSARGEEADHVAFKDFASDYIERGVLAASDVPSFGVSPRERRRLHREQAAREIRAVGPDMALIRARFGGRPPTRREIAKRQNDIVQRFSAIIPALRHVASPSRARTRAPRRARRTARPRIAVAAGDGPPGPPEPPPPKAKPLLGRGPQ